MNRHDGKAKLVEDFKPLYSKLPDSTLRQLMLTELVQVHRTNRGLHPVTAVARKIKCKG